MKLEHVANPSLLKSIRRSYWRISDRMKAEKVVTTKLFVFEHMDCSEVEWEFPRLVNFCLNVTVIATGEKFIATQEISFGHDDWTLYQVVKAK